jgi:hypothetical protein
MMLLPSSAVQVIQDSSDQLRVIFPPNWALSRWWILFAIVWLVMAQIFSSWSVRFKLLIPGLCLIPVLILLTSKQIDTFSREKGTLTMEQHLAFYHTQEVFSLKSVQQAVVATDENNGHLMSYVMGSGQEFHSDIGWMKRDGYYTAATAVNNFLAEGAIRKTAEPEAASPSMGDPDWVKQMDAKVAEQKRVYEERLAKGQRK